MEVKKCGVHVNQSWERCNCYWKLVGVQQHSHLADTYSSCRQQHSASRAQGSRAVHNIQTLQTTRLAHGAAHAWHQARGPSSIQEQDQL